MANQELLVSGVAIRPANLRPVYVPTRKYYHASYFHDDRYRHEIANHYRDFKMRPRLRRRKRGLLQYTYRKTVVRSAREMPYEYLEELPMAEQKLPRFDKVYTPRGRRTLCNEQRPDLICNDTLKRIEKALEVDDDNSSETLKQLAKRQLERFNGFPPNNRRAGDKQKYEKSHSEVKDFKIPNRPRNRRRSLGKLESVDRLTRQQQQTQSQRQLRQQQIPLKCGVIRPFAAEPGNQSTASATQADTKALTYYLQYAADYYKQGFLSNIEYLENVGERNQLRRKRLPQTLRQTTTSPSNCINQECCTSTSTTTSNNCTPIESSCGSIQRQTSVVHDSSGSKTAHSCNSILKNIARKHSFRIYRYNQKETEYPEISENSAHWPIRVQIKPVADSVAASQSNANANHNGKGSQQTRNTTTTKDCYSMNDYLNGNLELQQQQAPSHYNNQLIHFRNEYSDKGQQQLIDFDSLISNLQDLEIVQTNLPRITLTDYTHRYPTEYSRLEATSSLLSDKQHQSLNSALLRQSSIELSSPAKLELPLESTNYHSEARPPQNNLPI